MARATNRVTPEDCADSVLDCLRLTARFLIGISRGNAGDYQLTPPQFRVLDYLRNKPGASLSEVADHLGVRQPTASVIVVRLARHKLIRRAIDPKERRRVALHLSEAGAKLIAEARALVRQRLAARLQGLKSGELGDLAAGIEVLSRALARESSAAKQSRDLPPAKKAV